MCALEDVVVQSVLAIVAAVALLVGFAIQRMNPDKLRIYGESKLAKFGLVRQPQLGF